MTISQHTKTQREQFFRMGSHKQETFARMGSEQKRRYCRDILDVLCEEYPQDTHLRDFATVGKQVLLGTRHERVKSFFVSEKENVKNIALALSILLCFHPHQLPKFPIYQENKRTGECIECIDE